MKFKLNKIAIAMPLSLIALAAVAGKSPDDIPSVPVTKQISKAQQKATQAQAKDKYFVLLKDEPIALYQGGISGFKATNVAASNGVNATATGKLNLQSSASKIYGDYLSLKQNETISHIKSSLNRNVEIKDRFKVALNSLLVELEPHEVLALRKLPGVLAVEKNEMQQLLTDVGPTHTGATLIWENTDIDGPKGENIVVGVMDTGISSYTSQGYTWQGAAGFATKSIHPAFADIGSDGYDHTNPNGDGVYFGDCVDSPFWCNDKLIGVVSWDGYTDVGFSSSDMRTGTGQDHNGHGTHVASTIVGNVVNNVQYPTVYPDLEYNWKHEYYNSEKQVSVSGVAPHANLVSYKVCVTNGCWPAATVKSIEHAMENGVDVLNYSVGGGANSPWFSAGALAFLSAREAGIHTAIAAGNSGREGEKTIGSPGNSPWVTSVAALSHSRDFEEKTATFTGGAAELEDMFGKGATSGVGIDLPVDIVYGGDIEDPYYAETAGGAGYCINYSLPTADVAGKVVICKRGGVDNNGKPLSRLSKGKAALSGGAAGMIFINSDDEYDTVISDLHVLPTIHLNKADGETLLAWLAEGEGHQVSFNNSELSLNDEKGDITAAFTSRGPDYFTGDYLVPDVGAPGVDILAAGIGRNMHPYDFAPADKINGDWRFMSGTSMASPHIAGMYALMKAARSDWTPAEAQSAIMMTAYTAVKEDDDLDLVMNRADMHRTGSGSARVNLAIEAGLVLNETREGYLAANPHAKELGIEDSIANWHGEPSKMNLASLSKGSCLINCQWTRTFKATKDASWTVTFEHYNEGYTLSTDTESFTVNAGDEVELSFFAEALQGLDVEWVNSRVILTPDDASIPTQTLPVTINFIAGITPDEVEINAKRNNDSSTISDIVTMGTDDLTLSKSGIAKAEVSNFELMRDASNGVIFDHLDADSQTMKVIPLNIQADTKRLVVDVLETSSPDLDLYIGIDANLDGKLSYQEMDLIVYRAATPAALEKFDIIDPRNDTYWLLVHNWAEGPAPLSNTEMVCAEGQEPEEGMICADAPIMDNVKLSLTQVKYDDDSMSVQVPTSAAPLEEVDVRLAWDQTMSEGDVYHGVFWMGTSSDTPRNIGTIKVNMTRGIDDVKVSKPIVSGDKLLLNLDVAANHTGEARIYEFTIDLAEGSVVELLFGDTNIAGISQKLATENLDYTITGNQITWQYTQENGASSIAFNLIIDTSGIEGLTDATPVVSSKVNTSDVIEYVESEESQTPIFIEGKPVFSAIADMTEVLVGETVTLTAEVVDIVVEGAQVSYQWIQTSGTPVEFSAAEQSISFVVPSVTEDEVITFEMTGSNGSKEAAPVTVSVDVIYVAPVVAPVVAPEEDKGSSGGGTTGLSFLILAGLGLFSRRRK